MDKTMQVAVQATVGRALVDATNKVVSETVKDEQISIHSFITTPATVGVDMGLTLNLGNYESARVSVSVVVPCYKEEVSNAYEWAKEFVESRLKAESADVQAMKKNTAPF